MSAEWHEVRVGDLVAQGALAISDGYRVRNEELGPDGIPFVRGGDIQDGWINTDTHDHIRPEYADRVRGKLTQPDDIAFITKGTVGRAGRLRQGERQVIFAPQVSYWRVTNRAVLDPGFLYYLVRSRAFQDSLNGVKTHGSMVADYVSISQQQDFKVLLPDILSQQAITYILGNFDDKIELNRRMNETLEAIARALFKSWFVDFDPVHAKAEGRDPGLPKHLADLFPDSFESSGLREIPHGWRRGTLGEIAENPRRIVQPSQIDPAAPYIGLGHMPQRSITLSNWGCAREVESGKFEFQQGEILFGKLRPYFHKVGLAPVDGVCSTDILVVRPKDSAWLGFLLGHVATDEFIAYTDSGATGTRMPRTTWQEMTRYELILPPRQIAAQYNEYAHVFIKRIMINIHETRTLASLHEALLPRLISGELRIRNAERYSGGRA